MIFEGRTLSLIANSEIESLVDHHIKERQHIEFKSTIDLKQECNKLEALRDITSFANSGGGYIIVGIRDDGKGKAQKFGPELITDPEKIRKSIRDLCNDHIQERIIGLEFDSRIISDNPVILIRVPQSDRSPHMVTFQRRTDFYSRYEDGKREMSFAEIKNALQGDFISRRLTAIETTLNIIQENSQEESEREKVINALESSSSTSLLNVRSGVQLSESLRKRFQKHAGVVSFFAISAAPMQANSSLVNLESQPILELINKPPCHRRAGWNMYFEHFRIEPTALGIKRGKDSFRTIEIWRNGCVELRAQIDNDFCWGQKPDEFEKQPKFNPVTISEYVVSFLRFYGALLERSNYEGEALLNVQFLHIQGFQIRPRTWYHDTSNNFSEENLVLPDQKLVRGFIPDLSAYSLLKIIFASFGFGPEEIPAWNPEINKFEFEKLK